VCIVCGVAQKDACVNLVLEELDIPTCTKPDGLCGFTSARSNSSLACRWLIVGWQGNAVGFFFGVVHFVVSGSWQVLLDWLVRVEWLVRLDWLVRLEWLVWYTLL
jgi:hypothetical protein